MNAVFDVRTTTRGRPSPLALKPHTLAALDQFVRPQGVTGAAVVAWLNKSCNPTAELPWAVILWPQDYPVSGELAGLRYTHPNMPLSSYGTLHNDKLVSNPPILVSMLFVRRKAILEDIVRRSSLLNSAWLLLKDCSPRRSFMCLCDGPDREYTSDNLQTDADRYRLAMARAPRVPRLQHAWMDTPVMQFEAEVLQAAYATRRLDLASQVLERFCRQAPEDPWLWHCLGESLRMDGRNEDAVTAYDRALTLVPNWLSPRWGIVQARWAGQLSAAGPALDDLLETDPFDEHFLEPRLNGYARRLTPRNEVHAEALLRRYLALQPDSGRAWGELGTLLCYQGSFEEAIPCLRRAVILNPRIAGHWNNLAFAQASLGINLDAAAYACQRALDLNHTLPNFWDTLGTVAMKRGNFADAREAFETALRFNPAAADTCANLAEACRRLHAGRRGVVASSQSRVIRR